MSSHSSQARLSPIDILIQSPLPSPTGFWSCVLLFSNHYHRLLAVVVHQGLKHCIVSPPVRTILRDAADPLIRHSISYFFLAFNGVHGWKMGLSPTIILGFNALYCLCDLSILPGISSSSSCTSLSVLSLTFSSCFPWLGPVSILISALLTTPPSRASASVSWLPACWFPHLQLCDRFCNGD